LKENESTIDKKTKAVIIYLILALILLFIIGSRSVCENHHNFKANPATTAKSKIKG